MNNNKFLLYGANGYTGKLISRLASSFGLEPVLAGRKEEELRRLSAETGYSHFVTGLENIDKLQRVVQAFPLVVHAAGPFKFTLQPMVEACIRSRTHYMDINGDISCFERIHQYDRQAKDAGIMLLPGAGFDVVPTDCLALFLKNRMPDATRLRMAFASVGSTVSHGTAMTVAGKLGEGGLIRQNGKLIKRPLGEHGMMVDFGSKSRFVMSIPWGDIFTAYYTTGIPDIEMFTAMKPSVYRLMKLQGLFNPLLRTEFVRNIIRRKIEARAAGPDDQMLENGRSLLWGEVTTPNGERMTATMEAPEGYLLTARATLLIAQKILEGSMKPGYQTPAGCYGEDLIMEIPGVSRSAVKPG